jgi:hypothetical protein
MFPAKVADKGKHTFRAQCISSGCLTIFEIIKHKQFPCYVIFITRELLAEYNAV